MPTTETKTKQRSYFAKATVNRYILDDKESFIEHKKLDEGLFQLYQDITSKIRLEGDTTEVDMALGKQRAFLLDNLVTNWNLVDDEGPVQFTHGKLRELPPHTITGLIQDIYEKNEILAGETEDAGKEKKKT